MYISYANANYLTLISFISFAGKFIVQHCQQQINITLGGTVKCDRVAH